MGTLQDGTTSSPVTETTLKTASIQVERKRFNLVLKENALGRYVRITEVGPRKNSIIIPTSGVEVLVEMGV